MNITLRGIALAALVMLLAVPAAADDGAMFRKNVSKTPDLDTEHATVKMMKFYVASQNSAGELVSAEYCLPDEVSPCAETRLYAKPLVAFYHDGEVVHVPDVGFPGHGRKDVYGAISFDDGATWKSSNLSRSGDLSSFTLRDGTEYPGDTFRLFANGAGNKVMVAWASRFCQSAGPLHSWEDDAKDAFLAAFPEFDNPIDVDGQPYQLYTDDLFGVSGAQRSIDFADEGYPTVGEVPYACLWAARGTVEPASLNADGQLKYDPDGTLKTVVWRKAERITSGTRDVHRIEVHAAEDVGFIVTWQEDPEGLRPGKGEGPGEGWSGAIAHHQTDIWYTSIRWDLFDLVNPDPETDGFVVPVTLDLYTLDAAPQIGVPMAMPVRITDNAMCNAVKAYDSEGGLIDPYCYADFDGNTTPDLCADAFPWTNPGGTTMDLCQTEDGRVMGGRVASTRARDKLLPYDSDGDGINDSAWVMLAYEETKGLGTEIDPVTEDPVDIGKNLWYHSFDMSDPDLVAQGGMMNQPAVNWSVELTDPPTFFEFIANRFGQLDWDFYQTEIARRASLIAQPVTGKVLSSESGTVAMVLYKQGIIRQGGPADVFGRFFRLPDPFDPAVDNPYAYENMVCDGWDYTDGSNPNYVEGLCLDTPINLSATTLVTCEEVDCPTYPDDAVTFPPHFNYEIPDVDPPEIMKALTWAQCPAGNDEYDCSSGDDANDLDDQSWENPLDVAKGHRGFMDGDFIMMMYGWSPNWKANSEGHDHNNIYVRRSFDGGETWTTTPTGWDPGWAGDATWKADGTTSCEIFRTTDQTTTEYLCSQYAAGDPEPARNVSLLDSLNTTILDPRFTSTKGDMDGCDGEALYCVAPTEEYDDDERNASMYFVTYQTGDNTTVAETEATPLDMFYSRAVNWGDEYVVWTDPADAGSGTDTPCEPFLIDQDSVTLPGLCNEFDWLENKKNVHSAEAALATNPGGTLFYAIWDQWKEDAEEIPYESDAIHRRIWFIDDGESVEPPEPTPGGGPGGGGGGKP